MNLVVGMGEVGNGVFDVLRGKVQTACRDKDPIIIGKVDNLHICIPYSEEFEEQIKKYIKFYKPKLTIVYSTVPIGTCEKLGLVHSPVEGRHPVIGLSISNSQRWIGTSNEKLMTLAEKLWEKFVPVRKMPSADHTEWLKLRSTSKYGVNLVWADYEASVSKEIGMDFSANKQFDMDYNQLYEKMAMKQFSRYVLDPPEGKIGGHCVVPNAELLDKQYPNAMLKMVKEMK